MTDWLIARVSASREYEVALQMGEEGVEYWFPMFSKLSRTGSRRTPAKILCAGWPGYVLAKRGTVKNMEALRNIPGFYHFLMIDGECSTLTDAEVAVYKAQEARGEFLPLQVPGMTLPRPGDAVTALEWPFEGMKGEVEAVLKRKVKVSGGDFPKATWLPVLQLNRDSV